MSKRDTVGEIWEEINRRIPRQGGPMSRRNKVRHAISYCLRGDFTIDERIAQAEVIVDRHWPAAT